MEMTARALSSGMTEAGACNEGFLRDDALLVLVFITDEEDDHEVEIPNCSQSATSGSQGEPAQWFQYFVDVKGDERKVVVLSLVGPSDPTKQCPELEKCGDGVDGAEIAQRIIEFTGMFTHGFVGAVCEPYGPQFAEALSVIRSACETFVPVG
jgi:hypothetical protein